jgi:hypothetical protein
LNPGVRFVAGACGTKFGKTYGCTIRLVKEAWENQGSLNWWVAPTFDQSVIALGLVKNLLPDGFYKEYKAERRLEILNPNGSVRSEIQFKSGDNPDSLRGFGVRFFVLDEAARVPFESWVSLYTTITKTMGYGIVISTPKGRGWFYDVYQKGEKLTKQGTPRFQSHHPDCKRNTSIEQTSCECPDADPNPEWLSIRMPTWTNPTVSERAIMDAKRNLPAAVFQQEFAAEFLRESAGVFNNIEGCSKGTIETEILAGHQYVIGVDLARLRDFSVLTVMDRQRRHVVAQERFNSVKWEIQYDRIKRLSQAWGNALCVIDSTGIGDPIVEALRSGGVSVEPYKIGGHIAKQQLIEKLRVSLEKGRLSFPKTLAVLIDELERYEYNITDAGIIRYSAPPGGHDDCVISLALATWVADADPFIYRFYNKRGI